MIKLSQQRYNFDQNETVIESIRNDRQMEYEKKNQVMKFVMNNQLKGHGLNLKGSLTLKCSKQL